MTDNPLILAVETSGRIGSAAIAAGENLLDDVTFSAPMRHSAELFNAIRTMLDRFERKPRQVEHIYISIGPGSFTGLRIAATFAKIMHLANNVKIVAVDTLDVIARNVTDNTNKKNNLKKIATILDAKRGQFFTAAYKKENTHWTKFYPDCLMTAEQFRKHFAGDTEPIWLLGEGLLFHKDKFKEEGIRFLNDSYWCPKAAKVYQLGFQMALKGEFADALKLQPAYLRRPDAKVKSCMRKTKK